MLSGKFYGKYRGKVVGNADPMHLGRIQIMVPSVFGDDRLSWAMPCVPYAGPKVGWVMLPPKNANIWVEFEGGELNYPIWSGCFWGTDELPDIATSPTKKLLQTKGISLVLDETPGGDGVSITTISPATTQPLTMTLKKNEITFSNAPANVKLSPQGIEITLGASSIKLTPTGINMNNGALEVI